MSAKWEFVKSGEKSDPYAELLLAAQEARIRYDLLEALKRRPLPHPTGLYLWDKIYAELEDFRKQIENLMGQLGA